VIGSKDVVESGQMGRILRRLPGLTILASFLSLQPADSSAAGVGGLEFRAAPGESACFEAGEIGGCPFQLTIKLSTSEDVRAAVNPGSIAEMQAAAGGLMAAAMKGKLGEGEVTIRIPATLYGAGKFDNVLIFNSAGRSTTQELCRGEYQPKSNSSGLTGTVIIKTFTPRVLEGSYSAALYKRLSKLPKGRFTCSETPVAVEGRFRFSLPMLMDERFNLSVAEDDRIIALGTAAWIGGSVNWAADSLQEPNPSPEGIETITAESVDCECECDLLETPGSDPVCRSICMSRGLVCETEPVSEGDWSVEEAIHRLEEMGLPPESLGVLRQSLEQASPEERKMLIELYSRGLSSGANN